MDDAAPTLTIRTATLDDIPQLIALCRRAHPEMPPYTAAQLRGQIQTFPAGQLIATHRDRIIGHYATFRIAQGLALAPHSWSEITGGGFASRHQLRGAWLYGMAICVDPAHRGLRVGRRLLDACKQLCIRQNLKGIVAGSRLTGLARRWQQVGSVEAYIEQVAARKRRDPALSLNLQSGFEVVGVLADYLPWDGPSLGYAAHLVWRNPGSTLPESTAASQPSRGIDTRVRVAVVQYQQRRVDSFEAFGKSVAYFVGVAADYRADFVVFPELFTLQLLSIGNARLPASAAIATLSQYTAPLTTLLSDLAVRHEINIIGGSHPTMDGGNAVRNICYVCLRDGAIHQQAKIHPTPNERHWWQIQGGDGVATIPTDRGPIGILICYDCEFPELARHLIDQGAQILFVPFCTDERQGYLRVRYCAQARAVENQCYVALAGNVGNLSNVENMDIQYAQSCILTPCDFPFARDGIAAETTPNAEMVAFADLRLDALAEAREAGTVRNLSDRRFDLYEVKWRSPSD